MLIGDAAHAMLPTQGQGASQAIEDSEALGSFLEDVDESPAFEDLSNILEVSPVKEGQFWHRKGLTTHRISSSRVTHE